MTLRVRLHAALRKYSPEGPQTNVVDLELPAGTTVAGVVERLGIPEGHAKMFVGPDGNLDLDSALDDVNELNLFPPLVGG